MTDAGLKELAELTSLQKLALSNTTVTDAGLKELAGLKGLQGLGLAGTKVTDAGLKELAGLKRLRSLGLSRTKVTDAGLKELAGLKRLQILRLSGTKVTDAGVKEFLKALPRCHIIQNKVVPKPSDELIAAIKKLGEITFYSGGYHVRFSGTQVTDAGLEHLKGLTNLEDLNVDKTNVADAGLVPLV